MTEEEAKTKWCPFARIVTTISHTSKMSPVAFNREHRYEKESIESSMILPNSCLCIGSACMAWRWDKKIRVGGKVKFDMPIYDLRMTVRANNALTRGNYVTLGQLLKATDAELLKLGELGAKTLKDIREAVSEVVGSESQESVPSGYCGLAGKP